MMLMKAFMCVEAGRPLEMKHIPIPNVGENQVLVKIVACGACHTDLHIRDGNFKGNPLVKPGHKSLVLGHEGNIFKIERIFICFHIYLSYVCKFYF